ncbi:MAG: BrnT family toxin [Spirochaetes bacterium]|nr:BrnT family toxin [Spirochaetota bacterium]
MARFIWDEKKNLKNLKKHGVDFNDAVRAWYDPDRLDFFDEEHSSEGEMRWIFLGAVAGVVLFVVETEPDDETVRIISARRALKHEEETYYANKNH